MEYFKKSALLFLSFTLLLGACINLKQPNRKIEFYTLEYSPPQMNGLRPTPQVITVKRFGVAAMYNTNRMIYRDKSFKRDAYAYYKWWANPGDLVTHFLIRDMKESGLFKAVLSRTSIFPSTYRVEGKVEEFFEWDKKQFWEAILTVSIAFVAEEEPDISKRIIFQKTYRAKKPSKQRNPRALAEAMSHAMSDISGKIIRDIHSFLNNHK